MSNELKMTMIDYMDLSSNKRFTRIYTPYTNETIHDVIHKQLYKCKKLSNEYHNISSTNIEIILYEFRIKNNCVIWFKEC